MMLWLENTDRNRQEIRVRVEFECVNPADFKHSAQTLLAFAIESLMKSSPKGRKALYSSPPAKTFVICHKKRESHISSKVREQISLDQEKGVTGWTKVTSIYSVFIVEARSPNLKQGCASS